MASRNVFISIAHIYIKNRYYLLILCAQFLKNFFRAIFRYFYLNLPQTLDFPFLLVYYRI